MTSARATKRALAPAGATAKIKNLRATSEPTLVVDAT